MPEAEFHSGLWYFALEKSEEKTRPSTNYIKTTRRGMEVQTHRQSPPGQDECCAFRLCLTPASVTRQLPASHPPPTALLEALLEALLAHLKAHFSSRGILRGLQNPALLSTSYSFWVHLLPLPDALASAPRAHRPLLFLEPTSCGPASGPLYLPFPLSGKLLSQNPHG